MGIARTAAEDHHDLQVISSYDADDDEAQHIKDADRSQRRRDHRHIRITGTGTRRFTRSCSGSGSACDGGPLLPQIDTGTASCSTTKSRAMS